MKKITFISVLVGLYILTVFPAYGMYVGNYGQNTFTGGGPESAQNMEESQSIEGLIILSASYFLEGKAGIDSLSAKLEAHSINRVNYSELQAIADTASMNFFWAEYYYRLLLNRMEVTPYNDEAIAYLNQFDYEELRKRYGMNSVVFNSVKSYLSVGNVRSAYGQLHKFSGEIITTLSGIRTALYQWKYPNVDSVWAVNQQCCKMHMFGQYMAQVFYHLPMTKN